MSNLRIALIAASILFGWQPSQASIAWQGTTYMLHAMSSGVVLFYTTGTRSNDVPSCGAVQPNRFAIDSTTPGGKSQLATLLAADAAKRPIVVVGTGSCSVYGDSESVSYFYIAD